SEETCQLPKSSAATNKYEVQQTWSIEISCENIGKSPSWNRRLVSSVNGLDRTKERAPDCRATLSSFAGLSVFSREGPVHCVSGALSSPRAARIDSPREVHHRGELRGTPRQLRLPPATL